SLVFQPLISPLFGDTTTVVAPASSSALRGSVSSTCSKPSVARIAIFFPFKDAIFPPVRSHRVRRRSDQAGCQLQGFERGSDCSPERAAGDTPPPGLRAQIPLLQEVSGLAAKSFCDGTQIQSPLRNRLRVWRPPLGHGQKETENGIGQHFFRLVVGYTDRIEKPGENRASQNCYLSGTEQGGHAASHICVSGVPHVSALSFLSLLVRICTPGPGHNR